MRRTAHTWPHLLFALIFLVAAQARAGCTNPTNNEGDMTYNHTFHTMQFCDGTNWYSMKGGGGGSSGGLTLISTQTASASASLQFSAANWSSSYNTLFLDCSGLMLSTNNVGLCFQVGEGAGPTWETTNKYYVSLVAASNGDQGNANSTTETDLLGTCSANFSSPNQPLKSGYPISAKMYIDNAASATINKNVTSFAMLKGEVSGNVYEWLTTSYWANDTNALTGLKISPASGNITSGTCSLYGMN